jgi:hypothetical protein
MTKPYLLHGPEAARALGAGPWTVPNCGGAPSQEIEYRSGTARLVFTLKPNWANSPGRRTSVAVEPVDQ